MSRILKPESIGAISSTVHADVRRAVATIKEILSRYETAIADIIASGGIRWGSLDLSQSSLEDIPDRKHIYLQDIEAATSNTNDKVKDKHIGNADFVRWNVHVSNVDGNPHGTDHDMLDDIVQADDTSANTDGGKHVTDALVKKYEDHRNASQNVHGIGSENAVVGTGTAQTLSNKKFSDSITIEKTSGLGIKVELAAPTFPWRDLLGEIKILSPGANDPTLAVFRDGIKGYSFSNAVMNEVWNYYHIKHDHVPGSDIFIHAHWAQNVVDTGGPAGVPGDVKWQFEVTYAKGHNQAAYPASFTTSVTQTASGTQYQHMLGEIQLSAASPSATQIDSDNLEPDGVIKIRSFRDPADAADTLNQVPFLDYVDIHYQSTSIGTKQKAPDFYV